MQTKETKDNGTKGGSADFGCCNPEDLKKCLKQNAGVFRDKAIPQIFPR